MKKKVILILIGVALTLTAAWAASKALLYDSCNNCKITATEHKCGVCGSSMTNSSKYENGYLITTYKCKNSQCRHSCYTKEKY